MSALPDRVPYSGRLVFEEGPHRYRLDGEVIPGITSVLKRVGLVDDGYYNIEARDRGSAVHAAIEFLQEGDLKRESIAPLLIPYVEAWERFRDEMGWEPIERPELLVGSEVLRVATRIDGIGRVKGDPRIVVANWKTGSGSPEPWHPLQSSGEALLFAETTGRTTTLALRRAAVYLRPDGTYRWHPHPEQEARRDAEDFRAAVRTYHTHVRIGPKARKEN